MSVPCICRTKSNYRKRLIWSLARYDNFAIDVVNVVANETRTRRDTKVSPRGGLVFKPAENVSLYATCLNHSFPAVVSSSPILTAVIISLIRHTFTNVEGGL